jgi:light-regulated signal transduction histidine kinase (bacteriophytochrome)
VNKHDFKVDLTNCDREPIHILGAIQPIGFLVAVSSDWIVARSSANARDFIGRSQQEMVGHPLADFLPAMAIHDLRNRVALLRGPDAVERIFGCELVKGASLSISIIVEGELWGLFACHHYAARCPAFQKRSVGEMFAQMFSMRWKAANAATQWNMSAAHATSRISCWVRSRRMRRC